MGTADFISAVLRNPVNAALLRELDRLGLPDCWIVAGCLTQTAWNIRTGRPVGYGINDYDVFYFDPDLSWEAEDCVINACRSLSDRFGSRIEIRNQARVHLWYPQKHGKPYPALTRATEGVDRFLMQCTQIGISSNGQRVYAPAGLDDVWGLIVRPNVTQNFSAEAYRVKSARWQALWPELKIIPTDEF